VRTLPVDTLDLTPQKRDALADHPLVRAFHRELLKRLLAQNSGVTALVAMGRGARRLAPHVAPAGLAVIEIAAPGEPGATASWQAALTQLAGRTYTKDINNPSFDAPSARSQLPRIDLPYGTLLWVGTSGDRAVRPIDLAVNRPSPDYLKLFAPSWVAGLAPAPLSPAEQAAADQIS
jgi:hypothetical protein